MLPGMSLEMPLLPDIAWFDVKVGNPFMTLEPPFWESVPYCCGGGENGIVVGGALAVFGFEVEDVVASLAMSCCTSLGSSAVAFRFLFE